MVQRRRLRGRKRGPLQGLPGRRLGPHLQTRGRHLNAARTLLLVRHAHSQQQPGLPANRWGLSERGRQSCAAFAEALRPYNPAHIFSSVEPKTQQTAELIGARLSLPVRTFPGLHEHRRETLPFLPSRQDFLDLVEKLFLNPEQLVMGEETANQALTRFEKAVNQIIDQTPEGNILISTHGTVLTLFVAKYNPIDPVEFWRAIQMPDVFPLTIPGCRLNPKN